MASSGFSSSHKPYRSTLEREGITSAAASTINGSKFGKPKPTIFKARAQQAFDQNLPDRRINNAAKKAGDIIDVGKPHQDFLSRNQWVGLGEGWFQTTPLGTGSTTRCGLHSVVESSLGQFFMCLYEPRSKEAIAAVTSSNPEYDLEIHAKILTKASNTPSNSANNRIGKKSPYSFHIIFAFKSATEYCSVKCDDFLKCWQISLVTRGEEQVIREIPDDNIKVNMFYHLLIQIRGSNVSVDVNGTPIFTNIRLKERDNLGGLIGLFSKGTKFAIKGWKLKGLLSNSNNGATPKSVIATTEISSSSGQSVPYLQMPHQSVFSGFAGGAAGGAGTSGTPSSSGPNTQTPRKSSVSLMDALKAKNNGGAVNSASSSNSFSMAGSQSYSVSTQPTTATTGFKHSHSSDGHHRTMVLGGGTDDSSDNDSYSYSDHYTASNYKNNNNTNKEPSSAADTSDSTSLDNNNNNAEQQLQLAQCGGILLQSHDRGIVETVMRDVVQRDLGVTFDDIASLETAKRLLNEAIVLPLIMPEFFTGIREPWKGVLLFGPPGTGKTLLAKAVCSFHSSTFFSCSSSSLISKYRGESEKIVRCLFEAARICAPSIVFLDEIDALVSTRGDNEHEASRRLKTEIFSQMDGLASTKSVGDVKNKSVMVLATTNCPWDLDDALRRRLEKRIYIPLPDLAAREDLFQICLRKIPISLDVSIAVLAELSEGYSGSDVYTACKDAAMMPMRRLLEMRTPGEIVDMKSRGELTVPKVTLSDFRMAILNTRPSVASHTIGKYEAWEAEFSNR